MDICCFTKYVGLVVCGLSFIICSPCQPEFFYDVVTDSCGPCSDMCAQAKQKGTESQCRELCPDFSTSLKTSTMPATTTLSHNTTSPQSQDENIHNTAWTTIVVPIVVCTFVLILVIIPLVYCIYKRVRLDTRQHADNEQDGDNNTRRSRFLRNERQSTVGSQSETQSLTSIETNKTNEQAGQQPQEDGASAKLLVTCAQNSKSLEQEGIEAHTHLKELDTTQDQD